MEQPLEQMVLEKPAKKKRIQTQALDTQNLSQNRPRHKMKNYPTSGRQHRTPRGPWEERRLFTYNIKGIVHERNKQ